jgi:LDH2 family malate/lactate/ureidoglycolate dehydrogenase
MIQYLKDTPTMEGSDEVLYPGEIEARSRRQRLEHGVDIEDATWDQVSGLFREYGVEKELEGLG